MTNTFEDWLSCPRCGSDDVEWRYVNGYLYVDCADDDCLCGTSKLIGMHRSRT